MPRNDSSAIPRLFAIGCMMLALGGCKKVSTGAGEYFVQKYSCPAERMTLTARPDIKPSEAFPSPWAEPPVPDEVKNDPGRLEIWNTAQNTRRQRWEQIVGGKDMFQVSGCGHDVILGCEYARNTVGNKTSTYLNRVNCKEASAKKADPDG